MDVIMDVHWIMIDYLCYPLVNIQKNYGKSPLLIGKSTINGLFSIVMLVYQRVIGYKWI